MLATVREIQFPQHGDERGKLIACESLTELVPFEVKRVYYIFDTTPGTVRGKHAHKVLKQVLICVSGACTIECEMPDGGKSVYRLDWPDRGLLIEGMVWRNMKEFSKDAVLLVLASEHYDEADYIREYTKFRQFSECAITCQQE
jgi:dTDP-4-dehydrorhamnose 3,5-epimerase-like enzyme